ncbi:MAG: caa(3)-type oxidase, subunit [Phycisphaerales bacterium]|jgi:cytochrome c oxidase subunit IV|nr:caa(3)-type oxidase, subunit [Phycisphaerales bacterium]
MAEQHEHIVPPKVYASVLIALLALLIVTVFFAFFDVDRFTTAHHLGTGWNTAIALTVAITKAALILLFFMHVKYGSNLTSVFSAAGFVWLGIMITLTMSDYFTRNNPPGVNPRGEPKYVHPAPAPEEKPALERYPDSPKYYH